MSEDTEITAIDDREQRYQQLIPQIAQLIDGELDVIANLANVAAALQMAFGFHWVGFYRRVGDELVLGPFQGPIAYTRIPTRQGICGAAVREKRSIRVANVDTYPGHIAYSAHTRSEIVVPLLQDGEVKLVLEVDSTEENFFNEIDQRNLEQIVQLLRRKYTI